MSAEDTRNGIDEDGRVFRVCAPVRIGEFTQGNTEFVDDQGFLKDYARIAENSCMSPHRAFQLVKAARETLDVPGDCAEVGVYRGATAKLVADVLNRSKKLYLFDTFTGLPAERRSAVDCFPAGTFRDTSLENVQKLFSDNPDVVIRPGLFPDSAEGLFDPKQRFSLVHLDADLYESHLAGLRFFYSRMSHGGVIMMDDYGTDNCPGVQKATEEFLADKPESVVITTIYQGKIVKE